MALRPYEDVVGPLIIPVRGKNYALPVISLQDGLRMHAAGKNEADLPMDELTKIILGDAHQEMLDDGVPLPVIDRALWAGIADFQQGREGAEAVWENGAPKAVLEEMQRILQQAQTTPSDAETTTKPLASGNGTNTPKTKATRSHGRKSSPTGA